MRVPVQHILFTVFQSILEVFILCLAGFTLSAKGIVDKPTSKVLNHLNVALFTPALLFSKVAFFLTPAKLRQLWFIPIFFVVVTTVSAVIAHCLARACRLKRSQVNFATAASMFMNSNSLPVAIMQSLAVTVPVLKWGPNDTIDAMFGRSLTYLVVFSTLGMMLRWSYGIRLLSQADEPEPAIALPPTTYRDIDDRDQHSALTHDSVHPSATSPLIDYETETEIEARARHVSRPRSFRARLPHPHLTPISRYYPHPHLHSHLPAVPTSLGDQSESDDTDEHETTEGDGDSEDTIALRSHIDTGFSTETEDHAPVPTSAPLSSSEPTLPSFSRLFTVLTYLNPPLVASLFALFCVLVPPLQRLLKSQEMIPFKGALDSAGACSVPLTLLVLGGWFWDGDSNPKTKHNDGGINAVSDGRAYAKSKGKGVEKRHVTRHAPQSRESSTTSISELIGTFGDVLIAHIHPPRRSARMRPRVRDFLDANVGASDVESGPQLETHTDTEVEHAGNSVASQSQPPPRADAARGHARPSPTTTTPPTSTGPSGETLTVIVTLLARMVLAPLVITPMMILVSRLGWGREVFDDPVFIVSSMLLISSPPALTLAQISQRAKTMSTATTTTGAGTDAAAFSPFERLLSRTVFWSYLVLTPPITIISVMVGLVLVDT